MEDKENMEKGKSLYKTMTDGSLKFNDFGREMAHFDSNGYLYLEQGVLMASDVPKFFKWLKGIIDGN